VAVDLEQEPERGQGVDVVVDQEDPAPGGRGCRRDRRRRRLRGHRPDRQADHDLGATADPLAARLDGPSVQLDEPPGHGQSDPEPGAPALARRPDLLEQGEDAPEHLRRDARAGVPHAELGDVRGAREPDVELSPGRRVLHGVVQHVGDHLEEARRIPREDHRGVWRGDGQPVAAGVEGRAHRLHGLGDGLRQVHRAGPDLDLPLAHPRQVEQVFQQARLLKGLTIDDVEEALER
jgi:hypothetical protein